MMKFKKNPIITIFVLITAIFLLLPLYQLSEIEQNYKFFKPDHFFLISIVYIAIFFVVVVLLFLLISKINKSFGKIFLFYFSSYSLIAAFVFPIVNSSVMIEAMNTSVNYTNLFISSVLATIITLASMKIDNRIFSIHFFATILFISFTSFSAGKYLFFGNYHLEEKKNKFSTVSNIKNVFVLSFDGLSHSTVLDVFKNEINLKKKFKDFYFFSNAISTAPTTHPSIRSELFGNRDFRKGQFAGDITLDKPLDMSSLPYNIISDSYSYGNYGIYKNNDKKIEAGAYYKSLSLSNSFTDYKYWFELNLTRMIGPLGLRLLDILGIRNFPKLLLYTIFLSEEDHLIKNFSGEEWDLPSVLTIYDYLEIVKNFRTKPKDISLRYMHFNHTHFPVDFDENCNVGSISKKWFKENQNYKGHYAQTKCAMKQMSQFIEKLKKDNVYDKSLVVLKSDHGEHVYFYNKVPQKLRINDHPSIGIGRHEPLLMIKNFGQSLEETFVIDEIVVLSDLPITICSQIINHLPVGTCDKFPGKDLLKQNQFISEFDPIYIDIHYKNKSNKFDLPKTLKFDRNSGANLFEILQNSGKISLEE